jgi:nuclear pore complex protein Nup205
MTRIVAAAVLRQGAANVLQGRKFLTQSRGLVVHVLKRSAGIGAHGAGSSSTLRGANGAGVAKIQMELEERIEELAEAFMLLIVATDFLDVSAYTFPYRPQM